MKLIVVLNDETARHLLLTKSDRKMNVVTSQEV